MNKREVCLVMIVKDESNVIRRCLSAIKPYIDRWYIMDTGSTDDTIDIVKSTMEGIPGDIFEEEFKGFSYNRNKILDIARSKVSEEDYLFMIDADDTFISGGNFSWPNLELDGYGICHRMGGVSWYRPTLLKSSSKWVYYGVIHEYIQCSGNYTMAKIDGPVIMCGNDGARRSSEGASKYNRDAAILEKELDKDPLNKRNTFYLAQSYRDAGRIKDSIDTYEKRSKMGGYDEEVWYSLYQIAELKYRFKYNFDEVKQSYLNAFINRPSRSEPLHGLAFMHRREDRLHEAFVYASAAIGIERPPSDLLFVDESIYSWRALDEYCVSACLIGLLEQARWSALNLLSNKSVQGKSRRRIEENFTFSCKPISPIINKERPEITVVISSLDPDEGQLKESIQSIIDQSYSNWRLFVVSDGSGVELNRDDIVNLPGANGRISVINLKNNYGQFMIYDSILKRFGSDLFAIQDDDDVSHPDRFSKLLANMRRTSADVVFSDTEIKSDEGKAQIWPSHPEWLGDHPNDIVHTGDHIGLWKVSSLIKIGGYCGGFRLGADTLIVGLMCQLGRPSFLREVLYHVRRNVGSSMTTSPETGQKSSARSEAWKNIIKFWDQVKKSGDRISACKSLMDKNMESIKDRVSELNDEISREMS